LSLAVVCGDAIVRSDPVLLERIVRNLLANALRYTSAGGIVLGCRPRGRGYSLEVWDSGEGIPRRDIERIFEEFYQVGNSSRDRSRGLGLGLAIVRRLAELLGHDVFVASREGRGSVFRVVVPAGDPETAAIPFVPDVGHDLLAGRRILVIDDESDVRDATARLLTQWGCHVVAASDGDCAVRTYAASSPDAMIVDFRLGNGADGLETIASLRARFGRAIPAVLVSGASAAEELALIEASGIPLLHKPLPPARLRSVLAHLLRVANTADLPDVNASALPA
jgi:two-component system, sensor histidine kinase